MTVIRIAMTKFRNYQHAEFEFAPSMNILYGPNGAGKTSILEAIHCLAVTKSFRTSFDKELVQHGEDYYQLSGEFTTGESTETVQLNYMTNQGKKLILNNQEQRKLSSIIGRFPVVTLTPEDADITTGAPSVRRRYVNKIMSQGSADHLRHLIQLRDILQQRNAVLQEAADFHSGQIDSTLMSVYDDQLIEISEKIAIARRVFLDAFQTAVQSVFRSLSNGDRTVDIRYSPSVRYESHGQFDSDFRESLRDRRNQELGFRRTMVGPQTDIIDILLDGRSLRKYGSQGEHKLVLIALKLAEGRYLRETMEKPPIYLFDDLVAELDVMRSQNVLQSIDAGGQILITSTDLNDVREHGIQVSGEDIAIFDLSEAQYHEAYE